MWDGYQRKTKGVFIACEASHGYSSGRHFGSRAPTRVCHFENRALWAGYPDGQANYPTFQRNVHRDVMVVQLLTHVTDSSMCIKHIINPVRHQVKLIRRMKIEGSVKPISGTRCMKSGLNGVVWSVSANQLVAWSGNEVTRSMTRSRASDDTTNVRLGQGPNSCNGPRGQAWP
jgi:hypothetical protein